MEKLKTTFLFLKGKKKRKWLIKTFRVCYFGQHVKWYDIKWYCIYTISNDNLFDISILRQVPEIWYFHQFSFTYQKSMLNSQQNFHWSFNSSRGNTTQLSQPVSLRGLPSYIQNEQQTLFINPTEIPPAWSNTAKYAQGWHSGLSPLPPPTILMSLSKN